MKKLIVLGMVLGIVVVSGVGSAKEGPKVGVGFYSPCGLGNATNLLSGRVWLTPLIGVQGVVGRYGFEYDNKRPFPDNYKLEISGSEFGIGGLFKVVDGPNADLYVGAGIRKGSEEYEKTDGTEVEKVEYSATTYILGAGCEYFFDKLPNLGFSAEIGWSSMTETEKETGVTYEPTRKYNRTIGAQIALHYYFLR